MSNVINITTDNWLSFTAIEIISPYLYFHRQLINCQRCAQLPTYTSFDMEIAMTGWTKIGVRR